MEAMDNVPPAEVSGVAVRLPPFWAKQPAVWFTQAEAQFFLVGINCERTKFCYVISQLDHRFASEVEDIITSPPEQEPYTTLRTELVSRLSPSRGNIKPNPCWYNCRYGARTQKYTKPCAYRWQGQPTQQASLAAQFCTTSTSRLFIMLNERLSHGGSFGDIISYLIFVSYDVLALSHIVDGIKHNTPAIRTVKVKPLNCGKI
jgi:hypothetical protein